MSFQDISRPPTPETRAIRRACSGWLEGQTWEDCGQIGGGDPTISTVMSMVVHDGKLYAGRVLPSRDDFEPVAQWLVSVAPEKHAAVRGAT